MNTKDDSENNNGGEGRKSVEVIPDSQKIWGWDTSSWDLPEGLAVDLGLNPDNKIVKMGAREWGWSGWA